MNFFFFPQMMKTPRPNLASPRLTHIVPLILTDTHTARGIGGGLAFLLLSGCSSVVSVDPLSLPSAGWMKLRFSSSESSHPRNSWQP